MKHETYKTAWYFLLGILLLTHNTQGRKSFKYFIYQSLECSCNADFCDKYTGLISKDRQGIDLDMNIIKDLPVDLWLKVSIAHRLSKKKDNYRNIFAYDFNMCDIIGRDTFSKSFNLVNFWLNNIFKVTNMPRVCPIKAGLYYWKNFRPDRESIPAFILTGTYRIQARFYMRDFKNALLTNTTMLVDIKMR